MPDLVQSAKKGPGDKINIALTFPMKGKFVRPTFKSKWSSDSDSSDNESRQKSSEAKAGVILPKDSLTELEAFYNKLKSEKMRKISGDK